MTKRGGSTPLDRLKVLVGEWRIEASMGGTPVVSGRALFEWTEGGAFLVQHAEAGKVATTPPAWAENWPFPIVTIIALDDPSGNFTYAYSDARGVRRVYAMRLSETEWTISGEAGPKFLQRFRGKFSKDGASITGYWDRSEDGRNWKRDFDVIFTKPK